MGKSIKPNDKDTSDPYLRFTFPDGGLRGFTEFETRAIDKNLNPIWNQRI